MGTECPSERPLGDSLVTFSSLRKSLAARAAKRPAPQSETPAKPHQAAMAPSHLGSVPPIYSPLSAFQMICPRPMSRLELTTSTS